MKRADLAPETVQSLISDYREGMGLRPLAAKYGIGRETLGLILAAQGVPKHRAGGRAGFQRRPPETIAAMVADYQGGMGTLRLGKKYSLAAPTVTLILRAQGVAIRPKTALGMVKLPPVGSVFGGTTVVGPADIPFTLDSHGCRVYRVRVECWSCKTQRDVNVASLRQGASRLCKKCSTLANRGGVIYGDR